ncbi:MAG: deoxyribodipyrimidine photo-lyase [Spirochaetota bacterium]
MSKQKIIIFWFRRDLRLQDNTGLFLAQQQGFPVLPLFIFDIRILKGLPKDDARVGFIYQNLQSIHKELQKHSSSLLVRHGNPTLIWQELLQKYQIEAVYCNEDYEPYAMERDNKISRLLEKQGVRWQASKDQVIFAKDEILSGQGTPYTVYTPYKNKWLQVFYNSKLQHSDSANFLQYHRCRIAFPSLKDIGFQSSEITVPKYDLSCVPKYAELRDFPAMDATSYLGTYLRFGTLSIRELIHSVKEKSDVFLSELVWREFFMQILFHFPHVVKNNFRAKYDTVAWRNNKKEFSLWCQGKTGYPIVDAGMRQLNQSGYMHNRVRMIVAAFLCKHLLIDWRWGEKYFAEKLLDYELASNNGNWQWAAGTGCDAAPYFRVFNPWTQQQKFDKDLQYIRKWLPEFETKEYPTPMVEHSFARERALDTYKKGLG